MVNSADWKTDEIRDAIREFRRANPGTSGNKSMADFCRARFGLRLTMGQIAGAVYQWGFVGDYDRHLAKRRADRLENGRAARPVRSQPVLPPLASQLDKSDDWARVGLPRVLAKGEVDVIHQPAHKSIFTPPSVMNRVQSAERGQRNGARSAVIANGTAGHISPMSNQWRAPRVVPMPKPVVFSRFKECQWIEGDGPPWTCCGSDTTPGRPYCETHSKIAYVRIYTRQEVA